MPKVILLGAGMAGLAAAHELLERGYAVDMYEMQTVAGGKARSTTPPAAALGTNPGLPNEHGFRFFPGFYQHINDTMARIPFNGTTVAASLVQATEITLATPGEPPFKLPARAPAPGNLNGFLRDLKKLLQNPALPVPNDEKLFFLKKLICLFVSGEDRRFLAYDLKSWSDFIEVAGKSQGYRDLLANGLTRSLVAMQPEHGSTLTVGTILIQVLLDILDPNKQADRVLNGPTSEVWIEPWMQHLRSLGGLTEHFGKEVTGLAFDGTRIISATIRDGAGTETSVGSSADHFLCALPLDVMQRLLQTDPQGIKAAAGIAGIDNLISRWMTGVLFYLNREVGAPHGHVIYGQSPWALTSIDQQQFWRNSGRDISQDYGNGQVKDIVSAIISEWQQPGVFVPKDAEDAASATEIFTEVWEQLKQHRASWPSGQLQDSDKVSAWLDPAIQGFGTTPLINSEPLLVNVVGSHRNRPPAVTQIPNLFIASDYVLTFTDLATMEGANEAGRRAVSGILDQDDPTITKPRPRVFALEEPDFLRDLQKFDDVHFAPYHDNPTLAPPPLFCRLVDSLPLESLDNMIEEGKDLFGFFPASLKDL